jgi:hypothetical protein
MKDDQKLWLALAASLIALAGTILTSLLSLHSQRTVTRLNAKLSEAQQDRNDKREALKIIAKFRDPLAHASYDLQSRIYNIMKKNFLPRFLLMGSKREGWYAIENTVFLIAQFFCWTEIIRQEIQFLDLREDATTKALRNIQDRIYSQFQTDSLGHGFMIFAGEQRAVGELMIERSGEVSKCIGFAAFISSRPPSIDAWLDPLRDDLDAMALAPASFEQRLRTIQHSLIDLLDLIDPNCIYFPAHSRTKV